MQSYLRRYPGYYRTGDGGYVDADGYVYVMGRTDDVINVAGHRLSTGAMRVRTEIGAIAALRQVDIVPALPKTRSGKILWATMRGIADDRDEPVPLTALSVPVQDCERVQQFGPSGTHDHD